LAEQFAVSDETIRRDIKVLANKGLVERVHGGAVLPDLFREPNFQKRLNRDAEAKKAIARAAAAQVRDGDSLMLDTGSTTAYVARALTQRRNLMVVTNCAEIARTLATNGRNKVYLAGGEFRADDTASFGPSTIGFVERFRVRHAVLSIGAIAAADGFMDFHLSEAEFSRAVIACADRIMVVADHSKFSAQAPVQVCGFAEVGALITDQPPPAAIARRLAEARVTVTIAE
jgi:DeoR family glycerol-3-phosphate regulon repressor